jgi:hypothetical protein
MANARFLASIAFLLGAAGVVLLRAPEATRAASPLYPDLRTLPARNVQFDTATIEGASHQVLRFTSTIWNAGRGPLELRGESQSDRTYVYQRIYDEAGGFTEHAVGEFAYHEAHNHWHFENFAEYQLWTRAEYDAWETSGRLEGQARWRGSKTTGQGESYCVRDSRIVQMLPGSPEARGYRRCGLGLQGVSVGWGDSYPYYLPEQWIDLGQEALPAGEYVLRLIADPLNLLHESAERNDPDRESPRANESVAFLQIQTP